MTGDNAKNALHFIITSGGCFVKDTSGAAAGIPPEGKGRELMLKQQIVAQISQCYLCKFIKKVY